MVTSGKLFSLALFSNPLDPNMLLTWFTGFTTTILQPLGVLTDSCMNLSSHIPKQLACSSSTSLTPFERYTLSQCHFLCHLLHLLLNAGQCLLSGFAASPTFLHYMGYIAAVSLTLVVATLLLFTFVTTDSIHASFCLVGLYIHLLRYYIGLAYIHNDFCQS